ncbi:hypothetical protein Dda_2889 [Drechslerella dactyloides]|uniref:Uncharacterized protein n=1 Tax=Drechslerella dactyloides TaxID=74499 RepID=A0AAD6J1W3_DREDA|nr:hypothetical protein Dda_2889 [Drechslerella dactyloides]
MDESAQVRPISAAARAAALRAKMAGASIRIPRSTLGTDPATSQPTYLVTLDKFTSATEKWLENLEHLREVALKQQKRGRVDDPASSHERVHKTPCNKIASARKKQAEDVVMKDAPCNDDDSGKSVGSNDRIRPSTPTHTPRMADPPEFTMRDHTPTLPTSPPVRKLDEMDIRSPPANAVNIADVMEAESTVPAISQAPTQPSAQDDQPTTTSSLQPQISIQPPTVQVFSPPPILMTPPATSSGDVVDYSLKEQAPAPNALALPTIVSPMPVPLPTPPSENCLRIESSVKLTDALPTSSTKKRRLSSKTILESLMEKKAANPIWYDGAVQKLFHDMVFEMSHQIQSMKRESRIVMFARDPSCRNVLNNVDSMLQKSLRTVELSSFLFLKGKPDLSRVDTLTADLKKAREEVNEFRKSGWTMTGGSEEEDSSEGWDDDDDGSE